MQVGGQGQGWRGKVQSQWGRRIGQQGTESTPIRLTKRRIAKAPVIKLRAGFKAQRDVKLPENGVGRPAPPQRQKVRGEHQLPGSKRVELCGKGHGVNLQPHREGSGEKSPDLSLSSPTASCRSRGRGNQLVPPGHQAVWKVVERQMAKSRHKHSDSVGPTGRSGEAVPRWLSTYT